MSVKNDFPKTFLYSMILYSLQHFKALQLHIELLQKNNHNVNVNTFCKCKHVTLFWGKKSCREMKKKKIFCRAFRRKKNIQPTRLLEKKSLLTRNHPPPLPCVPQSAWIFSRLLKPTRHFFDKLISNASKLPRSFLSGNRSKMRVKCQCKFLTRLIFLFSSSSCYLLTSERDEDNHLNTRIIFILFL